MRLTLDSGKLLYALGVLFAAAALLYFARDVVFDLSITVKAALLFLAFVAFFVAGVTVERDVLDVVAFALAGVTYIVFIGYVVVRYDPGDTGIFLVLGLSAGLFVLLGYGLRADKLTVPRRQAVLLTGVLLLVSGVLVGADALGGGVAYDFEAEESVTVAPVTGDEPDFYGEREVRIGTVTATNEFVFTRALSLPSLRGCLAGVGDIPRNRVWVQYDYDGYREPNTIAGGTTREYPVRANIPVDANRTDAVTYTVEQGTDCDVQRTTPTLVVSVGANETRD